MSIEKYYRQLLVAGSSNLPLDQTTPIDEIKAEFNSGLICASCTNRDSILFGYGAYRAKIMFLNLCPSQYEIDIGIPYSDDVNKRLSGLISYLARKINLTNNIFYSYVVAHPVELVTKNDVLACRERLAREVEIVTPKCIVVLGLKTANALLNVNKGSLDDYRLKKVVTKFSGSYYPVYATHSLQDLLYKRDLIKKEVKADLDFIIAELGKRNI